MREISIRTIALLLAALGAGTLRAEELLEEIDAYKVGRLAEYNSVFLQGALYFATRHRIVKVDTTLLLQGDDFTVTPFPDMAPLHFKYEAIRGTEDDIYWTGRVETDENSPLTMIALHAWDLDKSGNALHSSQNRFTHSPHWRIDESGAPVLETLPAGEAGIAGPPPETPQDIERQRQLQELERHAFYSVTAGFSLPGVGRYVLTPLPYTPKYSVIYEVDPDSASIAHDRLPEEEDTRSARERMQALQYEAFVNRLPKETGKAVRGEIE